MRFEGESNIRWNDLFYTAENASGSPALTRESFAISGAGNDTGFQMNFFRNDQADEIQMAIQLDHGIVVPQTAKLHMHVIPMAAPTDGDKLIAFDVKWTLAKPDSATAIPLAIASWTAPSTATAHVLTANVYTHMVVPLCDIAIPAGTPHSSIILIRCTRNLATDTYEDNKSAGANSGAGNLGLIGFDLHVQRYRFGSTSEYTG